MVFKNIRKLILAIIPFLIMVSLALTIPDQLTQWDLSFSQFIFNLRNPLTDAYFRLMTSLGNVSFVLISTIIIVIFFAFFLKKWKIALTYGLAATVGNLLLNPAVKAIFNRPRPDQAFWLVFADSYSFPSGHSFVAAMNYSLLVYILRRYTGLSKYGKMLNIFLIITVLSIGFSRIYLGVHYLSDVIAGLSLGLSFYYLVHFLIEAYIDPIDPTLLGEKS